MSRFRTPRLRVQHIVSGIATLVPDDGTEAFDVPAQLLPAGATAGSLVEYDVSRPPDTMAFTLLTDEILAQRDHFRRRLRELFGEPVDLDPDLSL